MSESASILEFQDRDQWRQWLLANHALETEAWLVLHKVKYQDKGLSLDPAVEEALCFGWIDGTLKSLDEERYLLRFSPRTATSIWSIRNIHRVEKLTSAGKRTPAGYEKIAEAKASGEWDAALRREQVDIIPEGLIQALQEVNGGLDAYRALPASHKKCYIYWLQTAKRPETRQRRIRKILAEILET